MRAKPFGLAVSALVRDTRGRLLVLKRAGSSRFWAGLWDLPGGKVRQAERIDLALRREAREETGLRVVPMRLAGAVDFCPGSTQVVLLVLEAGCKPGRVRLSPEHDAFEWATPKRLESLAFVPHIGSFLRRYLL